MTDYFANENDIPFDEETQSLEKNKNTFHPLEVQIKRLILLLVIQTIKILTTQRLKTNLYKAIKSLKENDFIVIKKGEVFVVMNKTRYYNMIVKIFQDEVTHTKKSDENCDRKVFKDLENFVDKFSNCLLKEEQDFLTKFSFLASNFHILRRVQKGSIQVQNSKYIEIHDLTLQRIEVTGPNCCLSKLVDILLKSFLIHIESYIKGNLDFLPKCSRENK